MSWIKVLRHAAVSGTCAALTSSAALASAARAEGKAALRPLNSTSHWLNGDRAASHEAAGLSHTAVGFATHYAATIFWAIFFEAWLARRRPVRPVPLLRDALVLSAIAAAVDYGATPKRFTPGWEFVLTKRSMAVAYAAMAVGLAAGALVTQPTAIPRAAR